jgi:hypothetical protein
MKTLAVKLAKVFCPRCTHAPPENVELIAPIVADAASVLKKVKKFGDCMTSDMTPESYPNRKLPVAAKTARHILKKRPIF